MSVRRNPQRRAGAIALVTAVAGMSAWNTTAETWFTGSFQQEGEPVLRALTIDDLAIHGVIKAPTGAVEATYRILGMPAPRAWLVAALAACLVALLLRLSFFALAGTAMLWTARAAAVSMEGTLMSQAAEGRFVRDGSGFMTFIDHVWLLMALTLVLAAQLAYTNNVRRREQLERGETPDPGMLDAFQSVQESITGRFNKPVREPATAGADR